MKEKAEKPTKPLPEKPITLKEFGTLPENGVAAKTEIVTRGDDSVEAQVPTSQLSKTEGEPGELDDKDTANFSSSLPTKHSQERQPLLIRPSASHNILLRVLAAIIDVLILSVPVALIWFFITPEACDIHTMASTIRHTVYGGPPNFSQSLTVLLVLSFISCLVPIYPLTWLISPIAQYNVPHLAWSTILLLSVPILLTAFYTSCFESSRWQATIGKRLLGLRVANAGGERLSFRKAITRNLAKMMTLATLGIGLLAFILPRRESPHDLMTATRVMSTRAPDSVNKQPVIGPPPLAKITLAVVSLLVLTVLGQWIYESFVDERTTLMKIESLYKTGGIQRHPELLKISAHLVDTYAAESKFDQAEIALAQLKDLCKSKYGPTDIHYCSVLYRDMLLGRFGQPENRDRQLKLAEELLTIQTKKTNNAQLKIPPEVMREFGWDLGREIQSGIDLRENLTHAWLGAVNLSIKDKHYNQASEYCHKMMQRSILNIEADPANYGYWNLAVRGCQELFDCPGQKQEAIRCFEELLQAPKCPNQDFYNDILATYETMKAKASP